MLDAGHWDRWLAGSYEDAAALQKPYPADWMAVSGAVFPTKQRQVAGIDGVVMSDRNDRGETFGHYLIGLRDPEGALASLVATAKADPKFPRRGSPDDVRKRLNEMQASGDMHDAVDYAETDWRSC